MIAHLMTELGKQPGKPGRPQRRRAHQGTGRGGAEVERHAQQGDAMRNHGWGSAQLGL
jgi:hypothetical protein